MTPPLIPGDLRAEIIAALEACLPEPKRPGAPAAIDFRPAGGGDICHAARVVAGERSFVLKWRADAPPGFFPAEAGGLRRLAEAHSRAGTGVGVPRVVAVGQRFLLLEWIEPAAGPREEPAAWLGRGLARQHAITGPAYGLDRSTFLGRLSFPPARGDEWAAYYRDHRLAVLAEQAGRRGLLAGERARRLWRLLDRLEDWLAHRPEPSLLHGDLWGGNWLVGRSAATAGRWPPEGSVDPPEPRGPRGPAGGATRTLDTPRPYLIDPAVFYGDRELDLAMAALFGGFPPAFFAAYAEERPLPPGHEERQPLYQLYYLLAHLVLFGEGYGPAVDRILRRYAG